MTGPAELERVVELVSRRLSSRLAAPGHLAPPPLSDCARAASLRIALPRAVSPCSSESFQRSSRHDCRQGRATLAAPHASEHRPCISGYRLPRATDPYRVSARRVRWANAARSRARPGAWPRPRNRRPPRGLRPRPSTIAVPPRPMPPPRPARSTARRRGLRRQGRAGQTPTPPTPRSRCPRASRAPAPGPLPTPRP